uniref:Uncharacterized protein n=1 Tax=Ditylenchus dipsaci TaxID=166011 RepID=A0A915DM68_9BILA
MPPLPAAIIEEKPKTVRRPRIENVSPGTANKTQEKTTDKDRGKASGQALDKSNVKVDKLGAKMKKGDNKRQARSLRNRKTRPELSKTSS